MSLCICEEGGIQGPRLAGVSCVQAGVDLQRQMEQILINNPSSPDHDTQPNSFPNTMLQVMAHGGGYRVTPFLCIDSLFRNPPHTRTDKETMLGRSGGEGN